MNFGLIIFGAIWLTIAFLLLALGIGVIIDNINKKQRQKRIAKRNRDKDYNSIIYIIEHGLQNNNVLSNNNFD